jgi:hypothetical protein
MIRVLTRIPNLIGVICWLNYRLHKLGFFVAGVTIVYINSSKKLDANELHFRSGFSLFWSFVSCNIKGKYV